MRLRVFKKHYIDWQYASLFVEAVNEYKKCRKEKNFATINSLIWYRYKLFLLSDYAASDKAIHHINKYLKNNNVDIKLLYDLSELQKFAVEYRDNLPKKYINDFFRCRGLTIPPEIDEGYTTEEIDHDLCDKITEKYGQGFTVNVIELKKNKHRI